MITPGQYTLDAVNQLNKQIADVDTAVLYAQRNRARRHYRSEHPWSWAKSFAKLPVAALDSATGLYAAAMPADWDARFMPKITDTYGSPLTAVPYASLSYVAARTVRPSYFTADVANSRLLFAVDPGTLPLEYDVKLADLPLSAASDASTEPFPDATALTDLLIAYYWLATERASGKYQIHYGNYQDRIKEDRERDASFSGWVPAELPGIPVSR